MLAILLMFTVSGRNTVKCLERFSILIALEIFTCSSKIINKITRELCASTCQLWSFFTTHAQAYSGKLWGTEDQSRTKSPPSFGQFVSGNIIAADRQTWQYREDFPPVLSKCWSVMMGLTGLHDSYVSDICTIAVLC